MCQPVCQLTPPCIVSSCLSHLLACETLRTDPFPSTAIRSLLQYGFLQVGVDVHSICVAQHGHAASDRNWLPEPALASQHACHVRCALKPCCQLKLAVCLQTRCLLHICAAERTHNRAGTPVTGPTGKAIGCCLVAREGRVWIVCAAPVCRRVPVSHARLPCSSVFVSCACGCGSQGVFRPARGLPMMRAVLCCL